MVGSRSEREGGGSYRPSRERAALAVRSALGCAERTPLALFELGAVEARPQVPLDRGESESASREVPDALARAQMSTKTVTGSDALPAESMATIETALGPNSPYVMVAPVPMTISASSPLTWTS